MKKIMLAYDNITHPELKDYLLTLKGVKEVEVTNDEILKITVSYDEKETTIVVIKSEIELFLDIVKSSRLCAFDKFEKADKTYHGEKQHVCCEYCHSGFIEDLLDLDGVSKVTTNYSEFFFDREEKMYNVDIEYDSKIVTEEQVDKVFQDLYE